MKKKSKEMSQYRIVYTDLVGVLDVEFKEFPSSLLACQYVLEKVWRSRKYSGALVSRVLGDYYHPIMQFNMNGVQV